MKAKIEIDKAVQFRVLTEGEKPTFAVVHSGQSASTPLTPDEWRQIAHIASRTKIIELEGAEDLLSQGLMALDTVKRQAEALDGLRNELAASKGETEQFKGVAAGLEKTCALLETTIKTKNDELTKAQTDIAAANTTIDELRKVIEGMQAKIEELTAPTTPETPAPTA